MVDRLEAFMGHFSVRARTFQTGPLCGINALDGTDPYGQLHLLRKGKADFVCAHISFEGGAANPIASALPDCVCIPLSQLPDCVSVLTLLFAEKGGLLKASPPSQACREVLFQINFVKPWVKHRRATCSVGALV